MLHSSGQKDPPAGLKHHGSEGRIGPAARSPYCQTLLSELPRHLLQTFHLRAFLHCSELACVLLQDPSPGLKHHGSEGRIGPAAHSPYCQTLLSELPRHLLQTFHLRAFLRCQLRTCLRPLAAGLRPAQLRSQDPPAGLKHHGSEGRIGPAARSPYCQTLLSELPRN